MDSRAIVYGCNYFASLLVNSIFVLIKPKKMMYCADLSFKTDELCIPLDIVYTKDSILEE